MKDYLPLIHNIARSTHRSSAVIDNDDLVQIGMIAVDRAIKTHDSSRGANIKSFVTRLVRNDIYNEAARFLNVLTVDHRVKIKIPHTEPFGDVACTVSEYSLRELIDDLVLNENERYILDNRILGKSSAREAALFLELPIHKIYSIERNIKQKIKELIYE